MVHQFITPTRELTADAALPHLLAAALEGARAILSTPATAPATKMDGSPVTPADIASDAAIQAALAASLPGVPVVSEENVAQGLILDADRPFVLVDPLDGTKDYAAGSGEYAVCVALVIDRRPAAGVIVAPELRRAWTGASIAQDMRLTSDMQVRTRTRRSIGVWPETPRPVFLRSRFHPCDLAYRLMDLRLGSRVTALGAAIKFGLIASGEAVLYPRDAGSMEWDTAAGEAIIRAAGGSLVDRHGRAKRYGKQDVGFRNGPFIAGASEALVHAAVAQCNAF